VSALLVDILKARAFDNLLTSMSSGTAKACHDKPLDHGLEHYIKKSFIDKGLPDLILNLLFPIYLYQQ